MPKEEYEAKRHAEKVLFSLKARILQSYKHDKDEQLKTAVEEEVENILREILQLKFLIGRVSGLLGRVVIR